jgi:SAM-dependent methyltransferase
LVFALDRFDAELTPTDSHQAIDLGCGDGRDTVEILRRGWRVLAIDAEPAAIDRLVTRSYIPEVNLNHLDARIAYLEETSFPQQVDLINASFCLQFCSPDQFPEFWSRLVESLRSGGRFSGQLFGDRDSWIQQANICYHTRAEVEVLLHPFEVEFFEEEAHPGKTALGEEKFWHIFQIVARKK